MTQRDSLLAAVLDAPDDDLLRLVYADFLDDQGEPDRAELIRVQVEMAMRPSLSDVCRAAPTPCHRCADCLRWGALAGLERELLGRHGSRWRAADLPGVPQSFVTAAYRRGFVAKVEMGLADWMEYGRRAASLTPLEEVLLSDREPAPWRLVEGGTGVFWFCALPAYSDSWPADHMNGPNLLPADFLPAFAAIGAQSPAFFPRHFVFLDEPAARRALSAAALWLARRPAPELTPAPA